MGQRLEEGYYWTFNDYTMSDGTVREGSSIRMDLYSPETLPEGRNNYIHYQAGILTIHGDVNFSSVDAIGNVTSAMYVASGKLTVKGDGILGLYGIQIPALSVSDSAEIDFDLTPNGSSQQLSISASGSMAVWGDLTISQADRVCITTDDYPYDSDDTSYDTINGNAVIHAESVLIHNETNGACVRGDLRAEATDYLQIINQSETTAALTGGTYSLKTDYLNMQSYCGPMVDGNITLSPIENGEYGKFWIDGCTTGDVPVVMGNITVTGGDLSLRNQNKWSDTTDERYTQFKDLKADGPLLVGNLTMHNADGLRVNRQDAGTTPLIRGDLSLTDCADDGVRAAASIDRGYGSGAAVDGDITLQNSSLGIGAYCDDNNVLSTEPGIQNCTLTMKNSVLTVYSFLADWASIAIQDDYLWYVSEYTLSNPTYTKSTDQPLGTKSSTDKAYLEIRSGDRMKTTRAASFSGRITGTALQPVSATAYLNLHGDSYDFRQIPGYQELTMEDEEGEWTDYGIPAGTDLTDYLALETPQGGVHWKLTTAEAAYQDARTIVVTVSGIAGGTNCSEPVNLTISGRLLSSGEDLAVTPDQNGRWDITGSTTQATEYDLWVYGVQVTSRNQADILSNGMASFDPQTGTLFLKNADLQGEVANPVIRSTLDKLTLSVTGQNTLRSMEATAIDAKRMTVALANAGSSLTVCSDQKSAFVQNPILPSGAEVWSGDSVSTLSYSAQPNYTTSRCIKIALHEMKKTWTYDSENHWHVCAHEGCTQKAGAAQHTLQWKVDTPAVGTTPGWRHKICTICTYEGKQEILPCIKPIVETVSLPSATKNVRYSEFIKVIGTAPFQWELVSGTLPTGLTLNKDTGEISGTPTKTGTFEFTIKVTNEIGDDGENYSITVSPGMDISKLFSEKKTGCTKGSKDISLSNGESVIKKNQQYDFLYAAISHSMRNASQKEFDAVAGKLYNILFKAAYRPRCFGATRDTIANWPLQNAGKCGTSVKDAGLGQTVKFATSKGCASYAHFVSNYVYGKNGTSSFSKEVRIKSDAAEFKKYFEANVDPGETINYNYQNGGIHWIVFLGESKDEQGFYFISYEGGRAKGRGPFHNLNVGYWTYHAFASHVDNKSLCHWDTNKGSFSSGKYTALKIVSHCPVEMIVACGDEVLDSRDLSGSKTTALGTMTATGEGANRSVAVDLTADAGNFDLTLIGTDNGVMDLTVTHTYADEDGNPQEFTRQYSGVPVVKNGQITGLIPVDGDQTIQLDVPNPALESEMEYWLANPGDIITEPEAGYYPYNPDPDDNETPDSSSGSSGSSSVSNPSSVMIENTKNGHVTVSPETASKGDTVTVTARPNTGYHLDTITVTDQAGKEITLTAKGNGTFTFTMPASSVTVKATFKPAAFPAFTDVPSGSYYEEAVQWAAENGVTTGTDSTHFSPDGICTRAQAVTFLWRAVGSPTPKSNTMLFADVPTDSYYYDAVLWGVENGITNGTDDNTFCPNMVCSRAQIVTFLWRSQNSPAADTINPFADVKSGAYYADAVLWAVKNDITKGTGATTFSPDADCTRAQIVTFLWRTLA